jgi:hypothetical protein
MMDLHRLAGFPVFARESLDSVVPPQFQLIVFLVEAHPVSPMVIMTLTALRFNERFPASDTLMQ